MSKTAFKYKPKQQQRVAPKKYNKLPFKQHYKNQNSKQEPTIYATNKRLFLDVINHIPFSKYLFPFCDVQQKKIIVMLINFCKSHQIEFNLSSYKIRKLRKDSNALLGSLIEKITNTGIILTIDVNPKGQVHITYNKEIYSNDMIYCLSTAWLELMPKPIQYAYANLLNDNLLMSNYDEIEESYDVELISDIKGITIDEVKRAKKQYKAKKIEIKKLAKKYSYKKLQEFKTINPLEQEVKNNLLNVNILDFSVLYSHSTVSNQLLEQGYIELAGLYFTYFEDNILGDFLLNDIEHKTAQIGVAKPMKSITYTCIDDNTHFDNTLENKINQINDYLDLLTQNTYNCYA